MTTNLIALSAMLTLLCLASATCTVPTGIKDPSIFAAIPPQTKSPTDSVFFEHVLFATAAGASFEAPIQFHSVQSTISTVYNTMGAFEDLAIDVWGSEQPVRFCKDAPNFALYRSVTLAYICNMAFKDFFRSSAIDYDDVVTPWGIDPSLCFDDNKPDACADISTPWGLAFYRYNEIRDWISRDGWNRDGSLNRQFNRVPFQDWTKKPYIPKNTPWKLRNGERWQPLLEDNGNGFMFYQEHVVPHIGQFGRSFFVDDESFCSWTAPDPKYNFRRELDDLIARSAAMAEDDVVKAKVQIFDNKVSSLLALQVFLLFAKGVQGDSWEFIEADLVGSMSLYESGLLVWKEKISHDKIRPPTRLTRDRSGRNIMAYAGPHQGKRSMPAEDWEPYIRTMPHSEYPSGSACFCTVFANAMTQFFGSDKFIGQGGPVPLTLSVDAGKSIVEPGLPASNVTLSYSSWSEVARDCSQSRLDGGMHFKAAVTAGEALCAPLGQMAFDTVKALSSGVKPAFLQDFDKPLQKERRCR